MVIFLISLNLHSSKIWDLYKDFLSTVSKSAYISPICYSNVEIHFHVFVSSILDCLSLSIVSRSRRLDDRLDDEPFNFSLVSLPDLFICNNQASHPFMHFRIYKYIKIKRYDRGKYHSEGLFENIYQETAFFKKLKVNEFVCSIFQDVSVLILKVL